MKEKWKVLKSSYLHESPWLTVRLDAVELPNGHVIPDFYVLEYRDWVNVIALTTDGRFLLEKQYRHGIQEFSYELPAGIVDKGEEPMLATQRELLEETGYKGGEWNLFMKTAPNASAMTNYCYTYLAVGVEPSGETHLEESEDIESLLFTRDEVISLLESGQIIEADMVVPLWKLLSIHD